jgi:hypothetical protein
MFGRHLDCLVGRAGYDLPDPPGSGCGPARCPSYSPVGSGERGGSASVVPGAPAATKWRKFVLTLEEGP